MTLLDAAARDLQGIFTAPDLAMGVIFKPVEGGEFTLRAMFDNAYQDVQAGHTHLAGQQVVLWVPEASIQQHISRELTQQDQFVVSGNTYLVREPKPDGAGLLQIRLNKQGSPAPKPYPFNKR